MMKSGPLGDTAAVAERRSVLEMSGTARILACKAATISSAMLARRKSSTSGSAETKTPTNGAPQPTPATAAAPSRVQTARESVAVLAELLTMDSVALKRNFSESVIRMGIFNGILKLFCALSMISVCLHTPKTLSLLPTLQYSLLALDVIITLFFTFETFLKLFGRVEYHCVLPGTNPHNVTIADLAIPDTMCSKAGRGGYECPPNMECMRLHLFSRQSGFYGMFDDFGSSLFTVYLAASQEGWVYVLYDCLDSFPSYVAFLYFVTLIFFMAWLVKNVFIAVITETFAEIRVQFSEMWQNKETANEENYNHMRLQNTVDGWKLIEVDSDDLFNTPKTLFKVVRSTAFQSGVMILVLLNALINASFVHYHDKSDAERKVIYYYLEVAFTIIFDLECFLKLIAWNWRTYLKRGQHKFEMLLCIGGTLNVVPILYGSHVFTYFQVFRIIRLIKASPMLEDFLYKIFGPGRKLGGLVIFTMILLIMASAISLQLFCFVSNLDKFHTFPQAFMTMFQIMTQEGWTEVTVEILRTVNESMVPFVAIYFVGYHLFVTLIVLSLFVAVILDNLEMDEELKKIKQLKAREETTMRTTLPWRLRIFEKFPTRPQMVSLRKVSNEFPMPKVRDSFTRQFAEVGTDAFLLENDKTVGQTKRLLPHQPFLRNDLYEIRVRQIGQLSSKSSIAFLVEESNRNRILLSDSTQFIAQRAGPHRRDFTMRHRQRGLNGANSVRAAKMVYEHLKENGDVRPSDSAPKNDSKQGEIDIKALQQKRAQAEFTRNRIEEEMRENHPFFDRPLFAIGRDSQLRQLCQNIVYAKYVPEKLDPQSGKPIQLKYKQIHSLLGLMTYLDWAMVVVTALSCCSMLFESPWPPSGEYLVFNNIYLQICEYVFVVAMTFELAVKIVANGLFFTPKAVVRDVGGVMTVFIYITSVWYLVWMPSHVEINSLAQLLMIFRAMRPLRIYTLVPHIRRVVVELCKGFKEIILVTILLVLLVFVFASFGVQIVGGKLAGCTDSSIGSRENCTGFFEQKLFVTRMEVFGKNNDNLHPKLLVPRVWSNPRNFNFDHIGNAMLALFETLSYKGWNVIRDILWARQGPWAVVYIHFFVFIGSMIGITLFVGVVVANYMENRGTALLTVDQRRWHDLKARLRMAQPLHVPPKPSESAKFRRLFYEMTMSRSFKQILLKMIAFTVRGFWQSKRNRIDLLITILGMAWIVGHFVLAVPASVVSAQERLKRYTYTFGYMVVIMRFFTIAGRKSTLKMLMLTVLMSMVRSLFIITAMFLLVLFYAYAGVILFGMVKYGQAVSKHVNFRSGKEALVVLFRSVTGEDWNDIMHDCMRSPPFCFWEKGMDYWQTDCGNYFGSIIYFCSFYLIITYIVLNLLVAIIMENFSLFYSSEEDALLSYADIRNFQQVWNMVDTEQKRSIPIRRVKFLLRLLRGRLEVDPTKDRLLFKHMCYEMERLHNGEDVSFHDILNMLSYRSVDIRKSLQLEELLQREELEYIIEEEVAKHTIRSWLELCLRRIKMEEVFGKSAVQLFQKIQTDKSLIAQIRSSIGPTSTPLFSSMIQRVSRTELEPFAADSLRTATPEETEKPKSRLKSRRRSSIPDIEAKKLMWGSRMKSLPPQSTLPDRPNVTILNAETTENRSTFRTPSTSARLERRSTLKQLQMPTPELPDLDEWGEDETETPPTDRRHSLEVSPSNRVDMSDGIRRRSQGRQLGTVAELTNVVMNVLHPMPLQPSTSDVQNWWNSLVST